MKRLPWQQHLWQRVMEQVETNRLPHALLFSGPEGVGKLQFATQLAEVLMCESPAKQTSGHVACGQCKQCKLIAADTHPDLKLIQPEEGGSVIKVDQVRLLDEFFSQSSQQGGRKIAILNPAEALNINAANALLKTLEEPSANSLIILISHQAGMLLPTIRSRCQVVDFPLPVVEQSLDWLLDQSKQLDNTNCEHEDALNILSLAKQAPFTALAYLQSGAMAEYCLMLDELALFLKNERLSSELANRWNDDQAPLRLSWMIQWLEQLLKLKMQSAPETFLHAQKMMHYLAERAQPEQLFELYGLCLQQYRLLLGSSNPNKVLLFEMLLHRWQALMRKKQ